MDDDAKIAHAIRRTGALYMAIITSAEGTPDDVLFSRADKYATWIRGNAGRETEGEYLGLDPWSEQ